MLTLKQNLPAVFIEDIRPEESGKIPEELLLKRQFKQINLVNHTQMDSTSGVCGFSIILEVFIFSKILTCMV